MCSPICIVGTGYVGMACVVGLADLGYDVNGYDIQSERIRRYLMLSDQIGDKLHGYLCPTADSS